MNVGIVCEYNPLHTGHEKQFHAIRREFGGDCGIVCAMSGNFVQRGQPAIVDKSIRAEAAVRCGADLVVELPLTTSLSSAEGFAAGGVEVLSKICDTLCFGSETGNKAALLSTAETLLSPQFTQFLRQELGRGLSFPAARSSALEKMGNSSDLLIRPNDILAVEYCKAILSQGLDMDIFPIRRDGNYHAETADPENPSATALRLRMLRGESWEDYVPEAARELLAGAPLHHISAGEIVMLYALRIMSDAEFEALPYGSEGLWRKLMKACRRENSLEAILTSVKSKRYTRSRLDRMVMCAILGITAQDLCAPSPYARVLAFNEKGREILSSVKKEGFFRNCGEETQLPYEILERRAGDLYGVFCLAGLEPPGIERSRRVKYVR